MRAPRRSAIHRDDIRDNDKLSKVCEIARVLGVSGASVRKVLRSNSTAVPELQRPAHSAGSSATAGFTRSGFIDCRVPAVLWP